MLRILITPLALLLAVPPPAARGDDVSYAQARQALDNLRDENVRLQARLDARILATTVGQLVAVSVPGELLTPDAHRTPHVWSFGDGSPPRPGLNAGHLYAEAGTYEVTLDGQPYARVAVAERDPATVLQLPAGEVRGPIVATPGQLILGHPDGTVVTFDARSNGVDARAGNVTIRGVDFRQDDLERSIGMAVRPGDNTAWVDSTLERAAYGIVINAGERLDGLHLDNVRQIGMDTLNAYLIGSFGRDVLRVTVYDSTSDNSWHEHIFRFSGDGQGGGTQLVSIDRCDLTNLSEAEGGPKADMGKGSLLFQEGSFGTASHTRLNGPVNLGPLPGADGAKSEQAKATRWRSARLQDVLVTHDLDLFHGLEGATIVDSVIDGEIKIAGRSDAHAGRTASDIHLVDTTAFAARVGRDATGEFDRLTLLGHTGHNDDHPLPALRIDPSAQVKLEACRVPLIKIWPHPSVMLLGGQNDLEAYKRPGEVAGLEVAP